MLKLLFAGALLLSRAGACDAQYHNRSEPLLKIIREIEQQSNLTFLYRDALLADINIALDATKDDLIPVLKKRLAKRGLNLKFNAERDQAIIYAANRSRSRHTVSVGGQIVDAGTGERLPFATILWRQNGRSGGLQTNESGAFRLKNISAGRPLNIRCTYVGYAAKQIHLNLQDSTSLDELTFRLQPKRIDGNEIVVTGIRSQISLPEKSSDLINISHFSAMGESNTLRALQALPSVAITPAMSDGMHVRGSPSDGVRVMLDHITIFNQRHLFGLVDSFNADVLKRSGFYYGITPARLEAPSGGTLSLTTKTGSMKHVTGRAGLSNAAVRLTLSGPIKKGKSSWLISGRKSYLNSIGWFHNSRLVRWGLNVDRSDAPLDDGLTDFESFLLKPGQSRASFFDLHTKFYVEGRGGSRLIVSGYLGGDDTRQDAQRLFRSFASGKTGFGYRPVSTKNNWDNVAATAQYQFWMNDKVYASSIAGTSIYNSSFSKKDFTYREVDPTDHSLKAFVYPFENKSVLNEFKARQLFEYHADKWLWTGGLAYKYYLGEYYERSFDRPGYFSSRQAHKIDLFTEFDIPVASFARIKAGSRVNYYSNGRYVRWSPRLRVKLFPEGKISFSSGFSRNYQFLNQIDLSNTVTSNVWVLANKYQPPAGVDYATAGVHLSLSDLFYFQTEAYLKNFDHLRLHELNAFSLSSTYDANPWFSNNTGRAKGVEFLTRSDFSFLSLTQTFAISKTTLTNPVINDDKPFYADWDQTYRYGAVLSAEPVKDIHLHLAWSFATGNPNQLATFGAQNKQRLANYRRTDLSVEYRHAFAHEALKISASVFNLFDHSNPWYREMKIAIDEQTTPGQFRGVPADVYDIGIQPSFNISVGF